MGKLELFDDGHDGQDISEQLKVNQGFAQRFEHNKKREELHRLKEKYPEVAARLEAKAAAYGSEDESSSEEEDDGYIPDKTEAQIFETLMKISRKDKSIYDKEAKFYSSDDSEDDEEGGDGKKKKTKKEKPMYLKDVVYKEAMDRAAGLATDSDEEEEGGDGKGGRGGTRDTGVKTYNEEQEDLKKSFLNAFETEVVPEGEDEFGGVLKARRKAARDASNEDDDENGKGGGGEEAQVQELLDAYFTADGKKEMGEDDKFLRSFILKKGWVDHGDEDGDSDYDNDDRNGENVDDEEDEAAFEAAQAFEAHYNFRYEEPGSGQLITHPRQIEGTVRKEDDRRKKNRAEKAARKLAEEEERRAEVKRLKNLKKAEIEDRLHELQNVAGAAAPKEELLDDLLAGDFDPEAHDRAMAAAFGDDYYGEGDEEDEEDIEHDELFAKQLAAMGDYGEDEDEEDEENPAKKGTFAALQKRLKQEEEQAKEQGEDGSAGATAARSDIKRLLEEYHKLDYEDHVGGIPTRFRYKEVQPENYGLSIEEILMMDDKELNQVVGLKKVAAPYREEYKKVRPNYGALNEWRKEKEAERYEKDSRKKWKNKEEGVNGSGCGKKHKRDGRDGGGGDVDDERKKESSKPVRLTAEEQRLASFQVPTLKKKRDREGDGDKQMHSRSNKKNKYNNSNGGDGGHHRQQQGGSAAAAVVPSGLSKAQKKNMKRAAKRAAKQTIATPGAADA